MAETLAKDLTRAFLKRFGRRGTLYGVDAAFAWDVCREPSDDFTGPTINTYKWTVGNGGGASAASPAIATGRVNGQIQMVTGTANDNTASSTLAGGRHFYGQNNALIVARLCITSAVGSCKVEVGFRDAITTTAAAHDVVATKATPTFTATDGAVWIYDTTDNAYWEGVAVQNTTGATTVEAAITPVADTFEYLMVALEGTTAIYSRFNEDGLRTYGPVYQTSAVTADVLLSPHITVEARSATSRTVYVDWVLTMQGRTTA